MRTFVLWAFFMLSFLTWTNHLFAQHIKLTAKDSIRLKNIPELPMRAHIQNSRSPLPLSVDNTFNIYWRHIYQQWGCACGQASSDGYVFTYEMARKRNVNATLDANRYPYSFTYNFLNLGNTVCGASFLESQDIIREAGIPNVVTNNGVMTDGPMYKWLTGYDKYYAAMQNRINNVYAIHVGTPEGLDVLKHWLNDHLEDSEYGGLAFFYANHVDYPEELAAGTPEAGKHIITAFSNTSHAMTIVGYNDEVRYDYNNDGQYTNDIDITGDGIADMRDWEIGAFKIANTYAGSITPQEWADTGFSYVMYRILPYHNGSGGIWDKAAYVSDVKPNYSPLLTAKVNMTYTSRDKIKISVGVSSNLSATLPEHIEDFPHFRFQGENKYMQGGTTNADKTIEFGLDLTELLNYVETGQAAKYFLIVEEVDPSNLGTGTVNSFSVIDYTSGATEYISAQTNVPIEDNNTTRLNVQTTVNYSDVEITTDTVPRATLNLPYSAQVQASGGTQPYRWFPLYNYKITQVANTLVPITGTTLSNTVRNANLPFEFPFYGEKYTVGTASQYGALMFEFESADVPYDRDHSVLMRYFKSIAPFYGYHSSTTVRYEGNSSWAKYYWSAVFAGVTLQYMITLFPDGTIYIDYGNNTTPNNPEWQAGVSMGDQTSYQEFSFSSNSFPANTRLILEPRPFPDGLSIDNSGLITGTITEEFPSDSIFVKVVDNNWLVDTKGFLFTNRGLLFSNYVTTTSNNNVLEYGETAQLSFNLSNVGEASINNIDVELNDVDPNYVLTDSLGFLSTLTLGQTSTLNQVFEFQLANQIPDNTPVNFVINVHADEVDASDTVFFVVRAPKIEVINTIYTDAGDGVLDPGDTGDLTIYYKNTGGSTATNLTATYLPTDAYVSINSISNATKPILMPDSIWMVTLNITADAATPNGYVSILESTIDGDRDYHVEHDVLIGIGLIIENWESGTTTSYPWGGSGSADWYLDQTIVHEGNYALRSGVISHDQVSTLSLIGTVATSGQISFFKKVSSENNYDYLRFYIDSVQVAEWCGNLDWTEHAFNVQAGLHSFEWKYEKDESVNTGSDCAWIDYIVFPAIDFSSPAMEVSASLVEKTMLPNTTDTDTIFVSNTGGGLLTYNATIDNGTINTIAPPPTSENRSIAGSELTSNPNSVYTGMPISIQMTISNGSTDSEWLENLKISFPLGVTLDSATSFIGGTGGPMLWDQMHGNGSDVVWHGEDASGWGVVQGSQSATATFYLTIDDAITNSIVLLYEITGDIYGADPHVLTDVLILSNNGANDTWLTLGNPSGNLIAGENTELFLNFNTFGIPIGTYECNVSIESPTDSTGTHVVLHVTTETNMLEYRNELRVYPNPANQYVQIEMNPYENTQIELFDAVGKLIFQSTTNKSNYTLNLDDFAPGVYLILITQNNQRYLEKISISH